MRLDESRRAVSPHFRRLRVFALATFVLAALYLHSAAFFGHPPGATQEVRQGPPPHIAKALQKCRLLHAKAGPPPDFHSRTKSDRFVEGTKPTLITNATVWTGGEDGKQVVHGDILLDRGIITKVGQISRQLVSEANLDAYNHIDAQGKWVSPGIVDMHSHLGVYSLPVTMGALDGNSFRGPLLPWARALDAMNTHDDAFKTSASGGITTSLILPGSSNTIGGQAFLIKLRPTVQRSPTSMLLESPLESNSSLYDQTTHFRYRHMKQACGENPAEQYMGTRMDTAWEYRQAYEKARQVKEAQDEYCAMAENGQWAGLGHYPEDFQWEALVDVLRGRVKVHIHCYEAVDLDSLARLSNEFEFPIAAFHHATEAYLVPDTLKTMYGSPPALALFARHGRYKREAFRASEFAPRILAEHGFKIAMKSDHPVTDSRFLLWEAQQAHYYGLPPHIALSAVTSTPAGVLGQDHRIGYVKEGYDADLVLWDSHPLAFGATPQQVWIDGVPQLSDPITLSKPPSAQSVPSVPNFDSETADALAYDGLQPLEPHKRVHGTVVFTNVSAVYMRAQGGRRNGTGVARVFPDEAYTSHAEETAWAVTREGRVVCVGGPNSACFQDALRLADAGDVEVVDLEGGALSPGVTTFGSELGLDEIQAAKEVTTKDGTAPDGLLIPVPYLAGGPGGLIRAEDGLMFGTRNALISYRQGVTTGVIAPQSHGLIEGFGGGFIEGLSVAFALGARHKLEEGAIVQGSVAVHVGIHPVGTPSISTQIGALRQLLLHQTEGDLGVWFEKVRRGEAPLVVSVHSADMMATLIALKAEVEHTLKLQTPLRFTFSGAMEAHLLAKELAKAQIGVILTFPKPLPMLWESRRILPGPPLSKSAISVLVEHGVVVGIGTPLADSALNARFDAAWAMLESGGSISKEQAIELVSTNVETLLGVVDEGELVATRGGDLLEFSKVVSVISPRRGVVDIF